MKWGCLLYALLKYSFNHYFEFSSVSPFCILRGNNIFVLGSIRFNRESMDSRVLQYKAPVYEIWFMFTIQYPNIMVQNCFRVSTIFNSFLTVVVYFIKRGLTSMSKRQRNSHLRLISLPSFILLASVWTFELFAKIRMWYQHISSYYFFHIHERFLF